MMPRISEVKEPETKLFIKSQKIPVSNFIAIKQAKKQGTNIKARKLAVLVLKSETK